MTLCKFILRPHDHLRGTAAPSLGDPGADGSESGLHPAALLGLLSLPTATCVAAVCVCLLLRAKITS